MSRRLTEEEIRHCWDLGLDQAVSIPPETITKTPPAKVLLTLGKSLAQVFRVDASSKASAKPTLNLVATPFQPSVPIHSSPVVDACALFSDFEGRQSAAKNNDTEIPVSLWDDPFWYTLENLGRSSEFIASSRRLTVGRGDKPILAVLREWVLRVWRVSVWRSFQRYLRSPEVVNQDADLAAARDCLGRVLRLTFGNG